MPPSIYVPVWIDQYAIRSYRTVQLTTVQLSQTIGKCIGYLLNMYFGLEHWKKGFLVEAGYLIFCTICCLITSENYFSLTSYRPKLSDEEEKIYEFLVQYMKSKKSQKIKKKKNVISSMI